MWPSGWGCSASTTTISWCRQASRAVAEYLPVLTGGQDESVELADAAVADLADLPLVFAGLVPAGAGTGRRADGERLDAPGIAAAAVNAGGDEADVALQHLVPTVARWHAEPPAQDGERVLLGPEHGLPGKLLRMDWREPHCWLIAGGQTLADLESIRATIPAPGSPCNGSARNPDNRNRTLTPRGRCGARFGLEADLAALRSIWRHPAGVHGGDGLADVGGQRGGIGQIRPVPYLFRVKITSSGLSPAALPPAPDRIRSTALPPASSAFHGMIFTSYPRSPRSPSTAPYWAGRQYHGYSRRSRNRPPRNPAAQRKVSLAAARSPGVPSAAIPSRTTGTRMISRTTAKRMRRNHVMAGTASGRAHHEWYKAAQPAAGRRRGARSSLCPRSETTRSPLPA